MISKDTMILFDLDGTLWDSSENVAGSWNLVLKKRNIDRQLLTSDDIKAVMGKTMSEIADILFPMLDDETKASLADECMNFEVEYIAENGGILFEGVRETLEKLRNRGFKLAIVSNCQTGYIGAFLRSMNMSGFFCDTEEWGNTLRPKGENIRLVMERNGFSKGIYIGDTSGDEVAAKSAGIPFIFAYYGFGKVRDAEKIIYSFKELPNCLESEDAVW